MQIKWALELTEEPLISVWPPTASLGKTRVKVRRGLRALPSLMMFTLTSSGVDPCNTQAARSQPLIAQHGAARKTSQPSAESSQSWAESGPEALAGWLPLQHAHDPAWMHGSLDSPQYSGGDLRRAGAPGGAVGFNPRKRARPAGSS